MIKSKSLSCLMLIAILNPSMLVHASLILSLCSSLFLKEILIGTNVWLSQITVLWSSNRCSYGFAYLFKAKINDKTVIKLNNKYNDRNLIR